MGAQDREEHTQDVEMEEPSKLGGHSSQAKSADSGAKAKQQDTGDRHLEGSITLSPPHESNPRAMRQVRASEDNSSSASETLLTTTSPTSTSATSIDTHRSSSSKVPLPSIDEQIAIVSELIDKPAQDKQKGFLASTKWLNKVLARSSNPPEGIKADRFASEGEIGPIDNSDLVMVTEDSGKFKDERGEVFVPLRPGLAKIEDFRILPLDAWDRVVGWYGIGDSPVITRYAHRTSDADETACEYELYPPIFSLLKILAKDTTQTQKERDIRPVRMLASRETLFQDWLRRAKQLTNIDTSTKVRVWKVLNGLTSSGASGMLTPAASRSASPAPGANIVASAGDHLLLDQNTFGTLREGDQKELLDQKDESGNDKYNGKSLTLGIAGLARDEVIVLEEQKSNGDWPSENPRLNLVPGKGGLGKPKSAAGSGRSSPVPGMMTRGRQQKSGRPKGMTGLGNLGNTCYMNSALQCIRSVEELTQYFLSGHYNEELNRSNPLGHRGEVAVAYAGLLRNIYTDGQASFSPSKFKAVMGRYGPSFSGYQQQDSQEFLLFLLDGLQEDLNRIHTKPYIEKPDSTDEMVHDHAALVKFANDNWSIYKARNDSVITDLFAGMYKSTVTCPICDKVSIIFDPFSNLTLQLPIENNWSKEVLYFPLGQRPIKVDVDIDKHASIGMLKEFVARRTRTDPGRLVVAESYRSRFYKMFDNPTIMSEANIQPADIICVYELETIPTNYNPNKTKKYSSSIFTSSRDPDDPLVDIESSGADRLLVPVYSRQVKNAHTRSSRPFFGEPWYVIIDRNTAKSYDAILKKVLGGVATMTTRDILEAEGDNTTATTTPEDSDTVLMNEDDTSSDSNNVQALSVHGEDGLVDVSMQDANDSNTTRSRSPTTALHQALRPGAFIPPQLQGLFDIRVAHTGEGVPTGWNAIEENREYESVLARQPRIITHRPARAAGVLSVVNGTSSSASDDSDVSDIQHDASVPVPGDSGSESNGQSDQLSNSGSDAEVADVSDMFRSTESMRMTYSRKGKNKPLMRPHEPGTEALIRPGEAIILDWNAGAFEALFGGTEDDAMEMRGSPTWKNLELFQDDELIKKRARRQQRKKNGVSLSDCLDEFGKSETLSENNAWYCPRCKEHRRANKQFELWKAPDILVMHLKRFSSNRNFRDKLDVFVDYPTEGLDMSNRVIQREEGKSLVYDLVAVDNHYGGLGGGHYTAYAKNFVNGTWYEYNDSQVSSKSNPQNVVTQAAYLLFYRRRSEYPLGGPLLEELLGEHNAAADSEMQQGSREPSPSAGEGRRLGDSSHNGLPSAFTGAGHIHRVGDGGSATQQGTKQSLGATLGGGSPLRSSAATDEDSGDMPPGYRSHIEEGEHTFGNDPQPFEAMSGGWNAVNDPWSGIGGGMHSTMLSGHPGSAISDVGDADVEGDGSSTKVEGGDMSTPGSLHERLDDFSDDEQFKEANEANIHFVRESAPAPYEEDDDLPVVEIQPPPAGPD